MKTRLDTTNLSHSKAAGRSREVFFTACFAVRGRGGVEQEMHSLLLAEVQ